MKHATQGQHDLIILGAGASGLVCAAAAAGRGKSVLLMDHAAKPARKLSITGGGKCNLTNRRVSARDYVGENPDFCHSALARFSPEQLLSRLASAGIAVEEREHGQIFCKTSAKELCRYLIRTCLDLNCRMLLEERILGITQPLPGNEESTGETPARFLVHARTGCYAARSLVIALGSPAWPQIGASGFGYELAKSFGHRLVPIRPALTGLRMPEGWELSGLEGIAVPVSIEMHPPEQEAAARKNGLLTADTLPLLFTHNGISGPAALQASLYWRKGGSLSVDFLPGILPGDLLDAPSSGRQFCRSLFRRLLPDRLCAVLLPRQLADKKTAELSRRERDLIIRRLKAYELKPAACEGFAKAEVAAGGVSTEAVSSRSMESQIVPGLFFCGEILDVTGRLGGYNLHWAFASGRAAGEHA